MVSGTTSIGPPNISGTSTKSIPCLAMLAERLASSHSNVTSKCHLCIVNTKCSYVNTHLGRPAASVDEGRFVEIDTHGGEEVKRAKVEKWPARFSSRGWRGAEALTCCASGRV